MLKTRLGFYKRQEEQSIPGGEGQGMNEDGGSQIHKLEANGREATFWSMAPTATEYSDSTTSDVAHNHQTLETELFNSVW